MRYAMFISGGGTTMAQIIDATKSGGILSDVSVPLVIASRPDAGGIAKADAAGVRTVVRRPRDYPTSEAFGTALLADLKNAGADAFGQHGWMPKTPENVLEAFGCMSLNQHPGILDPGLPDFGADGMFGTRVHAATLLFMRMAQRRKPFTEASVQFVAPQFEEQLLRAKSLQSKSTMIRQACRAAYCRSSTSCAYEPSGHSLITTCEHWCVPSRSWAQRNITSSGKQSNSRGCSIQTVD